MRQVPPANSHAVLHSEPPDEYSLSEGPQAFHSLSQHTHNASPSHTEDAEVLMAEVSSLGRSLSSISSLPLPGASRKTSEVTRQTQEQGPLPSDTIDFDAHETASITTTRLTSSRSDVGDPHYGWSDAHASEPDSHNSNVNTLQDSSRTTINSYFFDTWYLQEQFYRASGTSPR